MTLRTELPDPFKGVSNHAIAITPADGSDVSGGFIDGFTVGSVGDVALVTGGNESVTLVGVAACVFIPLRVTRVLATGTTATGIVGYR